MNQKPLTFYFPRSTTMANLNKVMLIGRLTRDPEARMFANGGKVVNFGFAVNNSRKDPKSGEWINEPVFLDIEVFNSGEKGKLADTVEAYLKKGNQAFIEGKLKLDQWEDTTGNKRQKMKIVASAVSSLEPRSQDGDDNQSAPPATRNSSAPPRRSPPVASSVGDEADIPF
jgi:single-strand DNA-binding protein